MFMKYIWQGPGKAGNYGIINSIC